MFEHTDEKTIEFEQLLSEYQRILQENAKLRAENTELRTRLNILAETVSYETAASVDFSCKEKPELIVAGINNQNSPIDKIDFFMTLFKGRDDVYAKRWYSEMRSRTGYQPAC